MRKCGGGRKKVKGGGGDKYIDSSNNNRREKPFDLPSPVHSPKNNDFCAVVIKVRSLRFHHHDAPPAPVPASAPDPRANAGDAVRTQSKPQLPPQADSAAPAQLQAQVRPIQDLR